MHRNMILRTLAGLAAVVALAAIAPAHAASITVNDANCDDFSLGGSAGARTLTCVVSSVPTCTVSGPSSGLVGTPITLTAQCTPAATSWSWTGGNCTTGLTCSASSASVGQVGYTVAGTNATGPGAASPVWNVNWSNTPPVTPTGCNATVGTTPTTLTSAGGSANLNVTGCSPASGLTFAWSKNGQANFNTNQSWSDALPANTAQAGVTTSYQVKVCNGAACTALLPANPLTATVPGTGGGGGGGISGGKCTGFNVAQLNMVWTPGVQVSAYASSFRNGDIVVATFTTPATIGAGGSVNVVEYGGDGTLSTRYWSVSTDACDYVAKSAGGTAIATGQGFNGGVSFSTSHLTAGTTYYFNVQNSDFLGTPQCFANGGNCPVQVNLKGK